MSTPPPNPYGQEPPDQPSPYGYPTHRPTPPPTPPPVSASARPERSLRQKLRLAGAGLGAVVLVAGFFMSGSNPARAEVGDCVDAVGTNDVNKIACSDPKADYVVLSKFGNTRDVARCRETPGTASTFWSSTGRRYHRTKYVLCLGPIHGSPATGAS
ncbi:hypothetical protein [Kitasatospora sp. GP82]|uniref:LppU/SCO3897 family protein n=1 Tax=Kitasatospora sp. GP82 TaxID=3035089 RepID=UPI0024756192|nr:hypothetical protein [Kitasatospora sp. GP82]MDH6127666.1 hypothetical protein [Kitasatospora sp. GP82]